MKKPVIHPSAFVADNATVRGSVTLGANSSVFFGAVLRGDRGTDHHRCGHEYPG